MWNTLKPYTYYLIILFIVSVNFNFNFVLNQIKLIYLSSFYEECLWGGVDIIFIKSTVLF